MNNIVNSIKLIAWNPLGGSEQTIIEEIPINKNTTLADLFGHISSIMKVFYLPQYYTYYRWENYENACPFIKSKSTVYWNVPYNKVKVDDFLETHNIYDNTIIVEYDCLAGDSGELIDFLFQTWIAIEPIINNMGYAFTIKETIKLLANTFGKRKKKIPAFSTLELYLLKEDTWNLKQLVEQTRFPKTALIPILEMLGFEEHDGIYYKNAWRTHLYEVEKEAIDYNEYVSNYLGFNSNVPKYWAKALNLNLILLFELSNQVDGQKTYDRVAVEIEGMINEDDHEDCYDLEIDIIKEEIKRLERQMGFE